MRARHGLWALVVGGLLATQAGCVGGSKGLSAEEKEKLKDSILDSPPADLGNKVNVNFENKVYLIGFKVDPVPSKPGSKVNLTYIWRCDDTVDKDWKLFTHIEDDANKDKIGNLDDKGALRADKGGNQILGPDKWEKGKIYVETQEYEIPATVKGATLTVYTGIWKGDARLRIITGPNDGDGRAIAGQIKTGLEPPPPPTPSQQGALPRLSVNKLAANEKITIDGKADEPAWGVAASTGPFVNVKTGGPNTDFPVNGSAKLTWDDQSLYFFFDVKATDLLLFTDPKTAPGDYSASGQPKNWTKDTVEMMIDPEGDGDNKDYYELQIGPQNLLFKSQFDTLQMPNGGPNGPFGHEDWDPKLKSAAVVAKGPDGKDAGYTVEVAIPWAGFTKAAKKPPQNGDTWRVNLYAMKKNGGVSWSPIMEANSFHTAPRFGYVTFLVPGAVVANATGDAGRPAADAAAPAAATDGGAPRVLGMPRGGPPVHKMMPPQ